MSVREVTEADRRGLALGIPECGAATEATLREHLASARAGVDYWRDLSEIALRGRARASKLAYVAGPYRSPLGLYGVSRNIEAARDVARVLWTEMKLPTICPHANTALMDGPGTDDVFL